MCKKGLGMAAKHEDKSFGELVESTTKKYSIIHVCTFHIYSTCSVCVCVLSLGFHYMPGNGNVVSRIARIICHIKSNHCADTIYN